MLILCIVFGVILLAGIALALVGMARSMPSSCGAGFLATLFFHLVPAVVLFAIGALSLIIISIVWIVRSIW